MWLLVIFCLLVGMIIGFQMPVLLPLVYAKYMSIAVLAALDAVFGGIRAYMEDGFDKQSALLKLNYDKDIQAIEEYKDKMSKAQYTEAKNQYTSKHGDDKGFEGYFSSLKGEDLSKIMPSGLRSEDITANVNAYTKAANDAFDKGGRDINKNIAYKGMGSYLEI